MKQGQNTVYRPDPHFTLPHFGPILGPFWGQFGTHLETQNKGITLQNAYFGNKFTHLEHNLRDPGGRLFRDTDPGGPEVVVWPDALWRDYYCVHAR